MRRSHTGEDDTAASVNLTPMLDMAFILLIFFIVTASFTREQGLPVQRPSASSAEVLDRAPLVVSIDEQGQTRIDGRAVPATLLRQALSRAGSAGGPASRVIIIADRDLPIASLVAAMDAARLAGVTDVGIATEARRP